MKVTSAALSLWSGAKTLTTNLGTVKEIQTDNSENNRDGSRTVCKVSPQGLYEKLLVTVIPESRVNMKDVPSESRGFRGCNNSRVGMPRNCVFLLSFLANSFIFDLYSVMACQKPLLHKHFHTMELKQE